MPNTSKQRVSIEEARQILGEESKEISDQEISITIENLEELARFILSRYENYKCVKIEEK